MTLLYYKPPSDELFNEIKEKCIELWTEIKSYPRDLKEKVDRIKRLSNVEDNCMYMITMFDEHNQVRLARKLLPSTCMEVHNRIAAVNKTHNIFKKFRNQLEDDGLYKSAGFKTKKLPDGQEMVYFDGDSEGAPFKKGQRIEKALYEEGDEHLVGALGTIIGSIGPVPFRGRQESYCYFVEWDNSPQIYAACSDYKIKESINE